MPDLRAWGRARTAAWVRHWGQLLPLLVATFIVMLGFGAVIPVLPLFVTTLGIDVATLGLIVAGWAIGRLIFEPVFGWWADSHARKPQMVLALALVGISSLLMLVFTSATALFLLRLLAGMASGMFGPAARGSLVDATEPGSRGQAFGYFAAFQMGGFVLGPAIGAFGSGLLGGYAFPFVVMGVLGFASAIVLWRFGPPEPHVMAPLSRATQPMTPSTASAIGPAAIPSTALLESALLESALLEASVHEPAVPSETAAQGQAQAPLRALVNRVLIAAIILGIGAQLTFGIIDVVWSLYLIDLGASIEWVGITFMLIGLPSIFLAPVIGRYVDRWGSIPFVVAGSLVMIGAALAWAAAWEPILPSLIVPFEAASSGALATALFAMVAAGTPHGRASLAQGIYGSAGTMAVILSSILAGALWELGRPYPFLFYAGGVALSLAMGMLVYSGVPGRLIGRSSATARAPAPD